MIHLNITMISGTSYKCLSKNVNTLEEWIEEEFNHKGSWFRLNKNFVIRKEHIEKISVSAHCFCYPLCDGFKSIGPGIGEKIESNEKVRS